MSNLTKFGNKNLLYVSQKKPNLSASIAMSSNSTYQVERREAVVSKKYFVWSVEQQFRRLAIPL